MNRQEHTATAANGPVILQLLVEDFSSTPLANGKRMRDLLRAEPDAFRFASREVLSDIIDARGARYLADLLIPTLIDTTLPFDLALRVARAASQVDSQWHMRLVRFLVVGSLDGGELDETSAGRLLEILGAVGDTAGVQPFLRQMLLHPSPRIRSKITRLLSHGDAAPGAVEKLLKDSDSRVRANAVEALWSSSDPEAVRLLKEALQDSNNRVVGNAILGLHAVGQTQAITAALDLANHESPLFRLTAAWVMGKTEDPRFIPLLGRMLVESRGQARRTVFRALESIKKASIERHRKSPLRLGVLDARLESNLRARLRLAVSSDLMEPLPPVRATHLLVALNGQPVNAFDCEESLNDSAAVAFLLPGRVGASDSPLREIETALHSTLDSKRRSDQWMILRYRETSSGEALSGSIEALAKRWVSSNVDPLRAAIESPGLASDSRLGAASTAFALVASQWPTRAARHIVVLLKEATALSDSDIEGLGQAAASAKVSIHCLSLTRCIHFEHLCRTTLGLYRNSGLAELDKDLALIQSAACRSYAIELDLPGSTAGEFSRLDVRICASSPAGCGEVEWRDDKQVALPGAA